jgi:hypothetical protein
MPNICFACAFYFKLAGRTCVHCSGTPGQSMFGEVETMKKIALAILLFGTIVRAVSNPPRSQDLITGICDLISIRPEKGAHG